jgi:hypothetical protein
VQPTPTPDWESLIRDGYQRIGAAFRFELDRSRSPARILAWLILLLFPAAIMAVFRHHGRNLNQETWGVVLYLLATQSTTLLALLLWVAPAIQVELEGRTWPYLCVRPGGKLSVLLGKYLSGVAWTISAGMAGLVAAIAIAWSELASPFQLLIVLGSLQMLGAFAYGALYLAIGALVPRWA